LQADVTCLGSQVLNQSDMTVLGDPADGDRGRFRVLPGFGGTELFDADFHNFVFAPHFHDTLMLGLIVEGRKRFIRDKIVHEVGVGGLSVVNPGDTHTGGVAATDQRLRYTAVYPGAALLAEAGFPKGADLRAAVIDDQILGALFARAMAQDAPGEEAEESLLMALSALAARYGHGPARRPVVSLEAVTLAVDYIRSDLSAQLRLESIADKARVSPRHLIRSFRRTLGMTPQEYVRQARVREAVLRLRRGERSADVAQCAGFADQPHMTRAFRKVMGITPAAYARSWRKPIG
jgi:AraC-like DNA-binding protein